MFYVIVMFVTQYCTVTTTTRGVISSTLVNSSRDYCL
jgi:hypothetical protein